MMNDELARATYHLISQDENRLEVQVILHQEVRQRDAEQLHHHHIPLALRITRAYFGHTVCAGSLVQVGQRPEWWGARVPYPRS